MKRNSSAYITALTLFAALAIPVELAAQQEQRQNKPLRHYTVTDLGTLGGTFANAEAINNRGWVEGTSTLPDGNQHAFLWRSGILTDLGTLGGPNSGFTSLIPDFGPSERGQAIGQAETSTPDPLGVDFCLFGTKLVCLPFLWQNNVMRSLPTLGGSNGIAGGINNRGQVVGQAENTTRDTTCSAPGFEAKPVVWQNGEVQELPTFSGDPDGVVFAINNKGVAVGASGNCRAFIKANPGSASLHALLWQPDRTVTNLGNLGGELFNFAIDINDQGQVVGQSDLPGDTTSHAFLWTENAGMRDLGTLPGDVASSPGGINNKGEVVGASVDVAGDSTAVLWKDGVITDLNTLIPADSLFFLFLAFDINSRGQIVGWAETSSSEVHAFLATPSDNDTNVSTLHGSAGRRSRQFVLPESVRQMVRRRLGVLHHISQFEEPKD